MISWPHTLVQRWRAHRSRQLIDKPESNRKVRLRLLNMPELNVAVFSFLLNFPWEFWQVVFFIGVPSGAHWAGIRLCTQATVGDAVIAVASFWAVAIVVKSRRWILRSGWREVAGFVGVGVTITIILEALALGVLDRWAYAEAMPTLPMLGTGLLPVLQWIFIPPLVVWFVRRQLT